MIQQAQSRTTWPLVVALTVLAAMPVSAHEATQTLPDPGYRPDGYFSPAIADTLDSATIAVLPTIVRRTERSAVSFASQRQIVAHLNDQGYSAVAKPKRIDPGPHKRPSQWEIFLYGAGTVTEALQGYDTGTDYTLVMEILVPDFQHVFGIEVYLVDKQGEHVLSFLLNEHHEMFANAGLVARDTSEAARNEMIARATDVGLAALDRQLQLLRASSAS